MVVPAAARNQPVNRRIERRRTAPRTSRCQGSDGGTRGRGHYLAEPLLVNLGVRVLFPSVGPRLLEQLLVGVGLEHVLAGKSEWEEV
jgi:hypothetical protein